MTTKGADFKKIALAGLFTILIITLLAAFYTDNPDMGTPNSDTTSISCEEYDLRAVECPWNNKPTDSKLHNNTSVPAHG